MAFLRKRAIEQTRARIEGRAIDEMAEQLTGAIAEHIPTDARRPGRKRRVLPKLPALPLTS